MALDPLVFVAQEPLTRVRVLFTHILLDTQRTKLYGPFLASESENTAGHTAGHKINQIIIIYAFIC